jgi:hypothetical protein
VVLAGLAASYAPPGADAAVTTFALSPRSGPPGTVVHVSGAGCNPGLLGPPGNDFVTVTAPTLRVVVRVPVKDANGSWSGTFAVPAGSRTGTAGPVTASCVSSGLSSLTTTYKPQTFTVTAPPATTSGTSTTRPRSTTTPSTNPADHPSTVVGRPPVAPHVTGDTGTRVSSPGDTGGPAGSNAPSTTRGPGKPKHSASGGPASLQQVDLGSYVGSVGNDGLGWLSWLLLFALLIGAGGASSLIRRARRARESAAESETA